MKWLLILSLASFQTFAQEPRPTTPSEVSKDVEPTTETETFPLVKEEPVVEKVEAAALQVQQKVSGTSYYRENSRGTALVGFEFLSTWIPFKFTGSYTHIINKNWSIEGEIGRGSFGAGAFGFDLASITELRYSILARRYLRNSFNLLFGVYKNDLRAKLGSDILDNMSDTSIDDLNVKVFGAAVGFGNRWQWGNGFTLGIDWFRVNAPIFDRKVDRSVLNNIDDNSDYQVVEKVFDRASKIPTFVLGGLYLGYTF